MYGMGLSGGLRSNGTYARFGEIEDEFRATATALTTCIEQEIDDRNTEARRIRARDEDLENQRRTLTARQTDTDTRGAAPWA